MYGLAPVRCLGRRQAVPMDFRLNRFLRPFQPRTPSTSPSPQRSHKVKPDVRVLARGEHITAAANRVADKSRVHGDAVLLTTLSALDAVEQNAKLGALPFKKMALVHAIYPAGTSILDVTAPGRAAIRGVQIGKGTYVRDSHRRLHIYTMAYLG